MASIEKLKAELRGRPRTFHWRDVVRVARASGCEVRNLSGSRRAFIHRGGRKIVLHEPHGAEMKSYAVRDVAEFLEDVGEL